MHVELLVEVKKKVIEASYSRYVPLYCLASIIVVVRKMSGNALSLSVKNLSSCDSSLTLTLTMASYSPYSRSTSVASLKLSSILPSLNLTSL